MSNPPEIIHDLLRRLLSAVEKLQADLDSLPYKIDPCRDLSVGDWIFIVNDTPEQKEALKRNRSFVDKHGRGPYQISQTFPLRSFVEINSSPLPFGYAIPVICCVKTPPPSIPTEKVCKVCKKKCVLMDGDKCVICASKK